MAAHYLVCSTVTLYLLFVRGKMKSKVSMQQVKLGDKYFKKINIGYSLVLR